MHLTIGFRQYGTLCRWVALLPGMAGR